MGELYVFAGDGGDALKLLNFAPARFFSCVLVLRSVGIGHICVFGGEVARRLNNLAGILLLRCLIH